ncbi:MAG: class I SAM-dependent methyltransferase, partial [Myxococcales bacterium]|nr:class I SAM-dependent methyltransferase [Myxococcales bacterium]
MKLVQHRLGFYEVHPKPTPEELEAHYRDKYFAKGGATLTYAHEYTEEEVAHRYMEAAEALHLAPEGGRTLLDVGCGEGFFLDHFQRQGWEVRGVDYTDEGLMNHFPGLRERLVLADFYGYLEAAAARGERYDLVTCNNVLEHVIEPVELVRLLKGVVTPQGVCRIVVPNDGSWLQHEVVRRGYAEADFWLAPPEHLNYFTVESLGACLRSQGWEVVELLTQFPIDLFLLDPDSNYMRDRAKGRPCHFARVAFEVSLFQRSPEALLEF